MRKGFPKIIQAPRPFIWIGEEGRCDVDTLALLEEIGIHMAIVLEFSEIDAYMMPE